MAMIDALDYLKILFDAKDRCQEKLPAVDFANFPAPGTPEPAIAPSISDVLVSDTLHEECQLCLSTNCLEVLSIIGCSISDPGIYLIFHFVRCRHIIG